METKKPEAKDITKLLELTKKNEEAVHLLTKSIDEMVKLWNFSTLPPKPTKKKSQISN